jgi:hypothetical protein
VSDASDGLFLQSYVVPICTFSSVAKGVIIHDLQGTGFFINGSGLMLTAGHVLADAEEAAAKTKRSVGVVVKGDQGKSPNSFIVQIDAAEHAPKPHDVAILQTKYTGPTQLTLGSKRVTTWQNVATFGYPLNAVSGSPEALRLNVRGHAGYVQRVLKPDDHPFPPNPTAYEISFLTSRGLSGAPLFITQQPIGLVIGVCVGSVRSELIDDQRVEVQADGKTYRETRLRIEEYGVAHDILSLHDWKPKLLNGLTLLDASKMPVKTSNASAQSLKSQ